MKTSCTNDNNKLLTRKQAAEFLQCKESTLAIWKSTKRYPLPCIKIGKNVRYRLSDIVAFIENNIQQ
jgi:predicted DNA-binding transcriptional regulator AlpA